jgi:hypothetical protein
MKLWIGWQKEPYDKIVSEYLPISSSREEAVHYLNNEPYPRHYKVSAIQEIEIDTFHMLLKLFNCRDINYWRDAIYRLINTKDPKITFGERIEGPFK